MKKSKIGWTDHTWNVARGCQKVSEECKYCYMYRDSERYKNYNPQTPVITSESTLKLPYSKGFREKKLENGSRPLIFTSSLTDPFLVELDQYRDRMWRTMRENKDLIFLVLTKRPERIIQFLPEDWGDGYENVWLGTSVGMQKNIHRIEHLLNTPSKHHFLSAEPLIGELDLIDSDFLKSVIGSKTLDWVIVGGESGNDNGLWRYRECKLEWIEKIVNQCKESNTPVFVKQMGTFLSKHLEISRHGDAVEEFPHNLQIQDFPNFD